MSLFKPFRSPELSLWQAAVDEVITRHDLAGQLLAWADRAVAPHRADPADAMMQALVRLGTALEQGQPLPLSLAIMANSSVPGFLPSVHGFHFVNSFPVLPLPIAVPWGEMHLGDASGGLCGGMVFAVRDCFQRGTAIPPIVKAPESEDDPLFHYLGRRLVTSLDLPRGVMKYYTWMTWPDADYALLPWPPTAQLPGVRTTTVRDEWPAVQKLLDQGTLAPLGLVTVLSREPHDLAQNHQVLAYRYDLDEASGELRIGVYDPNCPNIDDISLALNVQAPAGVTASTGESVRGFFLTPYEPPSPADGFEAAFGG